MKEVPARAARPTPPPAPGGEYEGATPFEEVDFHSRRGAHPHAAARGQPAAPVAREGQKVKRGQVVGRVEESKLGAHVHSSIDGRVSKVTPERVEIVA